VNRILALIE